MILADANSQTTTAYTLNDAVETSPIAIESPVATVSSTIESATQSGQTIDDASMQTTSLILRIIFFGGIIAIALWLLIKKVLKK